MKTFKIGDIVKVIAYTANPTCCKDYLLLGTVTTVRGIYTRNSVKCYLLVGDTRFGYYANELQLITSTNI